MQKEYQTELIASDFEGSIYNPFDCIGSRAFSRAVGGQTLWAAYEGFNKDENGREIVHTSYRDDKPVNMMYDVKIGDIITFKQR